jgi:hypothetical protein
MFVLLYFYLLTTALPVFAGVYVDSDENIQMSITYRPTICLHAPTRPVVDFVLSSIFKEFRQRYRHEAQVGNETNQHQCKHGDKTETQPIGTS